MESEIAQHVGDGGIDSAGRRDGAHVVKRDAPDSAVAFFVAFGLLEAKVATRMARTARTDEIAAICTRERELNMTLFPYFFRPLK